MANGSLYYVKDGRVYDQSTGIDVTNNFGEILEESKNKRVYRVSTVVVPTASEGDPLIHKGGRGEFRAGGQGTFFRGGRGEFRAGGEKRLEDMN